MRSIYLFILILLLGAAVLFFFTFKQQTAPVVLTPTPTTSPTETQTNTEPVLCEPTQLTGSISTEPVAGNIYGSLTLKNSGSIPCNVTLGRSITATFSATNILLNQQPAPIPHEITLQPNEQAYSQVHFPNGPQCSGSVSPQPVTFLYEVDGKTVPFTDARTNRRTTTVQACSSAAEMTTIDIWPLSEKPIAQ